MRRVFLTKHSSWVYEEEVRVVKVWQSKLETAENYQDDPMRSFNFLSKEVAPGCMSEMVSGLLIYCHPAKIKEVYLGVRNPLLMNCEDGNPDHTLDSRLVEKADDEKWRVRKLTVSSNSWELKTEPVDSNVLLIRKKSSGLITCFEFSGREARFLKSAIPESVRANDRLELTNWNGRCYLKRNGNFLSLKTKSL